MVAPERQRPSALARLAWAATVAVVAQALLGCGVGLGFGATCKDDVECGSRICWNSQKYDPKCDGAICSVSCTTDAECVTAARKAYLPVASRAVCGEDHRCDLMQTGIGGFTCK